MFQLAWAESQLRESPILGVSPDFVSLLDQARRWVMNASLTAQQKHMDATRSVGPVETMSAGVSLLDDEPEFDDTEDMVSEDGDFEEDIELTDEVIDALYADVQPTDREAMRQADQLQQELKDRDRDTRFM
jgi:hypothetical protein